MAVTKRLRYEVLRRDNHACRYCGAAAPEVKLAVDHVVPRALGGRDEPENLVTACEPCNSGKSASAPNQQVVDDVAQDALRWATAMRQVIEERQHRREDLLAEASSLVGYWDSFWTNGSLRPVDAVEGLVRFLTGGVQGHLIASAMRTALAHQKIAHEDRWRYMCGICWREIEAVREETARRVQAQQTTTSADWGRLRSPVEFMVWTIPATKVVKENYARNVADLTDLRVRYWMDADSRVHRAGADCWSIAHLSELAFRTLENPLAVDDDQVSKWVELGHSHTFCGGCCMDLREAADA